MANLENDPTYATDLNDTTVTTDAFEDDGYSGQFSAVEDGEVICLTCHERMPANSLDADALKRTEGASDPDDMTATVAITCSHCDTKGTLVLHFGAEATMEEQDVLRDLNDHRDRSTGGQQPAS